MMNKAPASTAQWYKRAHFANVCQCQLHGSSFFMERDGGKMGVTRSSHLLQAYAASETLTDPGHSFAMKEHSLFVLHC